MNGQTMKLFKRLLVLALLIAIDSHLAACRRKGSPDRPEDSEYPHSYPSQ